MRLFIAIDFPDDLKKYLVGVARMLEMPAAKIAIAREFHLTLKFLGDDYPDRKIPTVERMLSRIEFKPFEGRLSTIGTFGEGKSLRVVWGGVEPLAPFAALAKQVDKATPDVTNDFPDYAPHITFARVKKVIASEAFKERIASLKLEPRVFKVQEFKLYSSEGLPNGGHKYTVLSTFPCKAL